MTGRRAVGALAVAVAMAVAPGARAQPSAEVQKQATDLVNDGIKLQSKRDYDGAVGKYKAAYCLIPEPALVYNIGTAYQEASRGAEAASYFRLYLKIAPSGDLASDAKAAVKELKDKTGSVGQIVCEAPKPPEPTCGPDEDLVDGACKARPPTCVPPQELVAGRCMAVLSAGSEGGGGGHRNNKLFYGGLGAAGAGAVALTVGIVYGIKAKNASDALSNHTSGPWTQELLDKEKAGKDAERNQIIFTVVGGALVAGGAVMVVLGLRHHGGDETATSVVPWLDADGAGVALTGSY
jgi:tetratricopeptide (TPR) repeat protein